MTRELTIEHLQWRKQVLDRDKRRCVLCANEVNIEAHHIKRWVDNPELRYDVNNGATLCKICHDLNHHEHGYNFPQRTTDIINQYIQDRISGKELIPKGYRAKSRSNKYWD
jgi:exopolyphosphatase/pppGpp-phosphohydrolase